MGENKVFELKPPGVFVPVKDMPRRLGKCPGCGKFVIALMPGLLVDVVDGEYLVHQDRCRGR